jgi:hypothetical protein
MKSFFEGKERPDVVAAKAGAAASARQRLDEKKVPAETAFPGVPR